MHEKSDSYRNKMDGDFISAISNIRPTFQGMGASAKIDYILVVNKKQLPTSMCICIWFGNTFNCAYTEPLAVISTGFIKKNMST